MINYVDRDRIPHCLFLGDLSAFCTEELLEKIFAPFGRIALLQIARSKKSNIKKHLMFGFLGYENATSAANAMKTMDGQIVCGRAIKIQWSTAVQMQNNPKPLETFYLKVMNVPDDCNIQELNTLFADFQNVLTLDMCHSKSTAYPRRKQPYGLAQFQDAATAASAMKQLDGQILRGRTLEVKWATQSAQSKKKKAGSSSSSSSASREDKENDISLFVSFVAMTPEVIITEETLRQVFGVFGEIDDVAIRLTLQDTVTNVQKGYGFIYFDWKTVGRQLGIQAAMKAGDVFVVDQEIHQVFYHVELSNKLKKEVGIAKKSEPMTTSNTHPKFPNKQQRQQTSANNHNNFSKNNASSSSGDFRPFPPPPANHPQNMIYSTVSTMNGFPITPSMGFPFGEVGQQQQQQCLQMARGLGDLDTTPSAVAEGVAASPAFMMMIPNPHGRNGNHDEVMYYPVYPHHPYATTAAATAAMSGAYYTTTPAGPPPGPGLPPPTSYPMMPYHAMPNHLYFPIPTANPMQQPIYSTTTLLPPPPPSLHTPSTHTTTTLPLSSHPPHYLSGYTTQQSVATSSPTATAGTTSDLASNTNTTPTTTPGHMIFYPQYHHLSSSTSSSVAATATTAYLPSPSTTTANYPYQLHYQQQSASNATTTTSTTATTTMNSPLHRTSTEQQQQQQQKQQYYKNTTSTATNYPYHRHT